MGTSTGADETTDVAQPYQLTALSELAQSFKGPKYGSTLVISPQGSIRIGRNVPPSQGYCLPAQWVQVSGNHCQVSWDREAGGYVVTDTSTNGTYVNGVRVPKGGSCPLKPGDLLHLSVAPEQDPVKALEYRFEPCRAPTAPVKNHDAQLGPHKDKRDVQLAVDTAPSPGSALVKRKRAASPVRFASADALAQLLKNNQELQRKVESAREQTRAAEARAANDIAALNARISELQGQAEAAFASEREKATSSAMAATASYKHALETMKARVAQLEQQVETYATETAKLEAAVKEHKAKQEEAEGALEQMAQQKHESECALNSTISKLRSSEAALTEELQSCRAKATSAVAQVADLQHQIEFEKANVSHAEHLRKQAEEDLQEARTARQNEERLRRVAEEAQTSLRQQLDEAIWQNERAEEGRDQALGASAVQQAYLRQVLSITSSLTAARQAEETARARAAAARNEADKSLAVLQKQVVTALNPDMDEAHVEQYMKDMQSSYEAEEATQRSNDCQGTLPQGSESQEVHHGFDPEATQMEADPSDIDALKEFSMDLPRKAAHRCVGSAAVGSPDGLGDDKKTSDYGGTNEHVNVSLRVRADEARDPIVVAHLHAGMSTADPTEQTCSSNAKVARVSSSCDLSGPRQSVPDVTLPDEGEHLGSRRSLGTPADYVPLGSEAPIVCIGEMNSGKEVAGIEEDVNKARFTGQSEEAVEDLSVSMEGIEGADKGGRIEHSNGAGQQQFDDLDDTT